MYNIDDIKNSTYIGQYVDLYDIPAGGSFVASGTTLLRSSHPELDAVYPSPPYNIVETITLTDGTDISGTQGFRHKRLRVYKSGNIIVVSGICEFLYTSSWVRISYDNGATWNLWNSVYSGSVNANDNASFYYAVACDGHGKWLAFDGRNNISTNNAVSFAYPTGDLDGYGFYHATGAGSSHLTTIACEYTTNYTIWAMRNGYQGVMSISIDDGVTWINTQAFIGDLFTWKNKITSVYNSSGLVRVAQYDYDADTWYYRTPSDSETMVDFTYNNDIMLILTNVGRIIYAGDTSNFDGWWIGTHPWDTINCTETHIVFTVSSTGQTGIMPITDIGIGEPTLTIEPYYGYPENTYYMGNNIFWSGMDIGWMDDRLGIMKFKLQNYNPNIDIPVDGDKFVRIK